MAKKRKTLKQKKQAKIRKLSQASSEPVKPSAPSYVYKNNKQTKVPTASKIKENKTFDEDVILIVPSHYIRQDLTKTVILTIIFLGIIFGLYWYIELGGENILRF